MILRDLELPNLKSIGSVALGSSQILQSGPWSEKGWTNTPGLRAQIAWSYGTLLSTPTTRWHNSTQRSLSFQIRCEIATPNKLDVASMPIDLKL